MRKPQGYAQIIDPDSPVWESDTYTCFHCQLVVYVKPREDPASLGGVCKGCMQLICAPCADKRDRGGGCTPWEKEMERSEAKERFIKSAGLREW